MGLAENGIADLSKLALWPVIGRKRKRAVEFVSPTGSYPTSCYAALTNGRVCGFQ
jgi:hypothetical protein